MGEKNTDLEVTGTAAKRRKKKSTTERLKSKFNIFWLKVKLFLCERKKKKKNKKKRAAKKVSALRKTVVILLNVLGMVALIFLVPYLTLVWLDGYTNHGEEYKVPSVHGKELAEAAGILESKKLDYKIIKIEYSDKVADNVVLQMYPDSGSVVKEGRKIGLVLSTTVKPRKTIPSVIDNRTFREAESHIKAAGFNIERVDTINGEKDWVYEVRYKRKPLVNGDAIPEGSNVVVVIGNGEKVVEEGNVEFDDSFDI